MIRLAVFVGLLCIVLGVALAANPQTRAAVGQIAGLRTPAPAPTIDQACDRASHLAKTGWSARDPEERYEAADDGLDAIAACGDDDERIFGQAMLLSMKTEAEYRMQIGNARWDATRAVEQLDLCAARFAHTAPQQAATCKSNRARILTYFPGPPAPKS